MEKVKKSEIINQISELLTQHSYCFLTDCSGLSVIEMNEMRRACFAQQITIKTAKNSLIKKALEKNGDIKDNLLVDQLKGPSSLMLGASAKQIAKFIIKHRKKSPKPLLKGAFVEDEYYIGDNQVAYLSTFKSKNDLIADLVSLLSSPINNLINGLGSPSKTLAGALKTLENKK